MRAKGRAKTVWEKRMRRRKAVRRLSIIMIIVSSGASGVGRKVGIDGSGGLVWGVFWQMQGWPGSLAGSRWQRAHLDSSARIIGFFAVGGKRGRAIAQGNRI